MILYSSRVAHDAQKTLHTPIQPILVGRDGHALQVVNVLRLPLCRYSSMYGYTFDLTALLVCGISASEERFRRLGWLDTCFHLLFE